MSRTGRGVLTAAAALAVAGGAAGTAFGGQLPTAPAVNGDYHEPEAEAAGHGETGVDPEGPSGAQVQGRTQSSTAGSAVPVDAETHGGANTDSGGAVGGAVHSGPSAVGQGGGGLTYDTDDRGAGQLHGGTHAVTGSGAEIHSEMDATRSAGVELGAGQVSVHVTD